jgi:predicted O-methyltransferase YrrM
VVELGTNIGSTAMILSHCAISVYTVDVFESLAFIEDVEQREKYRNHWESNRHTFDKIKNKLSFYPNVKVHQGTSYNYAEYFGAECVDLIFIDADHSYNGVKKDFESWFTKIKIGGHFAFHDVGLGCPVFDFYNKELLHDPRIKLMPNVAEGPCWTKVFKKL